MAKIQPNSFQQEVSQYGSFHKSTTLPLSMRKKAELNIATRQFMFGINQKKDNFNKTKQGKLF